MGAAGQPRLPEGGEWVVQTRVMSQGVCLSGHLGLWGHGCEASAGQDNGLTLLERGQDARADVISLRRASSAVGQPSVSAPMSSRSAQVLGTQYVLKDKNGVRC